MLYASCRRMNKTWVRAGFGLFRVLLSIMEAVCSVLALTQTVRLSDSDRNLFAIMSRFGMALRNWHCVALLDCFGLIA